MSQAKVDKYKQEKYSRKHPEKKSKFKKVFKYIYSTVIVLALVGCFGVVFNIIPLPFEPEVATTHTEWSKDQVESLRNALIQNNDSNVKGNTATKSNQVVTQAAKKSDSKSTAKAKAKKSDK